jgi:nicotinate-nucleotide pyrophosphorylase (carboxylating)
MGIPGIELNRIIDAALSEDLGLGDPTTEALIPPETTDRATLVARESGVAAGIEVAVATFLRVDPDLQATMLLDDGSSVESGARLAAIEGSFASILKAERTALNFAQRMSGIATQTSQYVAVVAGVEGAHCAIVDTRKTAPGLRAIDKLAVELGGGRNHRQALGDGILIKDNHIDVLRSRGMSLVEIVRQARARARHTIRVEVEVQSNDEVAEALEGGVDIIMLDNMAPEVMAEAVQQIDGRAIVEASGGITLDSIAEIAATGVDIISVGALTHSSQALDIGLDYG